VFALGFKNTVLGPLIWKKTGSLQQKKAPKVWYVKTNLYMAAQWVLYACIHADI